MVDTSQLLGAPRTLRLGCARQGTGPSRPGNAGYRPGARSASELECSAAPSARRPEAPIDTSGCTPPAALKVAYTGQPSAASPGRRQRLGPKAPVQSLSPTRAPRSEVVAPQPPRASRSD